MKQRHNMLIYTCIWVVAILILVISVMQDFGHAKVINYSGIVRGATQQLVKKEMYGEQADDLIIYLDGILKNLETGQGDYNLVKLTDKTYQDELSEINSMWQVIKLEIQKVRKGESKDKLFSLSEEYFIKADEMVARAQSISDENMNNLMSVFVGYLVVTISVFIFWFKYKQRQIEKALYVDELTGVNNFAGFEIELKKKVENIEEDMALLCIDIDGFKYLNSLYGTQVGDQLLRIVAWTLQAYALEEGCVGRYGSDKFLMMCKYKEETIASLKKVIIENVKSTIELDIYRDFSICMGVYMLQIDDINNMIDNVTLAHKHAKKQGKGGCLYYDQRLLNQLYYESRLTNNMHSALREKQFKLYLQPKFEIPSLKIVGAEALVRWQEEDKILFPDEFIPLFEQNGFIYELDFYMLEQVCEFIKKNHLETTDFRISVNFSRVTIHHQDFCQTIEGIMEKYEVPVQCIEFEITESAFNDFSPYIIEMLKSLYEKGYVFSMDDFGAGYSSLSSIHTIPIDIIKIDKAFLEATHQNKNVISIMGLIVETAHLLGKTIICEGVEDIKDIQLLNNLGCYLGQGYYVSKPIEQLDFIKKFLSHN